MKIKRVCIFCGSNVGNNPVYVKQTRAFGKALTQHNIGLVYGGGAIGLMNEVANAILMHGGEVHGVIPEHLNERAHNDLTALHITQTMHERKAMMAELSDAFVALPGGFGTLDELMEITTWAQLGLHHKPVIIFNINGYYDMLIKFLHTATDSEFISRENFSLLKMADSITDCLKYLIPE